MTPKVIEQAQSLLDEGLHPNEVAEELGIKKDTLSKAVSAGRLKVTKKDLTPTASSESERSGEDSETPVGMGATDIEGRMAASIGDLNAVLPSFQHVQAVPLAGVRFALPALLSNGLLDHKKSFFGTDQIG
ncbi:MAG: orotate phosphoribosyltransferase-like protein [Alteromonadaceae bacterium]